jgi:hypothetical protein
VADLDKMSRPPWTHDQVGSLNAYQESGALHPFTCGACRDRTDDGNDYRLTATCDGWECAFCGYTQTWAWPFMTDWSWKEATHWLDKPPKSELIDGDGS